MAKTVDQMLELADLCTPWCMRAVVTIGVADHLKHAPPVSIDQLADLTGSDADCLQRVMRHLTHMGVFCETTPGWFSHNELSRALLEPAVRLALNLDGIGGRLAGAWGTLPDVVRSGRTRYEDVFGVSFWDDLADNPAIAASFDALMGPEGKGTPDASVLLNNDWAAVRSVVDVGGGTGSLLAEILRAQPHIAGTLVDLPRTVARSAGTFAAAGVSDRATVVGQSFFDPLPAGADLYLLHGVLNDWPDQDAVRILHRCASAAPPTGRILILRGVAPEAGTGDLLMMVLFGAKYRTPAELTELAAEAGLKVRATGRTPLGCSVVECSPDGDVNS